jgi:hypothetical protein
MGLMAPLEHKNGWWLAEHAGHAAPDRMRRLLHTAICDDVRIRADLREVVVAQLGHPDAVPHAVEAAAPTSAATQLIGVICIGAKVPLWTRYAQMSAVAGDCSPDGSNAKLFVMPWCL